MRTNFGEAWLEEKAGIAREELVSEVCKCANIQQPTANIQFASANIGYWLLDIGYWIFAHFKILRGCTGLQRQHVRQELYEAALDEVLGDLDGVQRGAAEELIARNEHL